MCFFPACLLNSGLIYLSPEESFSTKGRAILRREKPKALKAVSKGLLAACQLESGSPDRCSKRAAGGGTPTKGGWRRFEISFNTFITILDKIETIQLSAKFAAITSGGKIEKFRLRAVKKLTEEKTKTKLSEL